MEECKKVRFLENNKSKVLRVGDIQALSTVDYPKEAVSVIFCYGCPFRCPFCFNKPLVIGNEYSSMTPREVSKSLERHRSYITGVCFTGGEPLMQYYQLVQLITEIKKLGLLVKLDTNGFYPKSLALLLDLVDYIAVDIKATPKMYGTAIGMLKLATKAVKKLERSMTILSQSAVEYEFRTTIVPSLNDFAYDMKEICMFIKPYINEKQYILQLFKPLHTLNPIYQQIRSPSYQAMRELKEVALSYLPYVEIRGVGNEV